MASNKRGNIYGQGKPENPYEERESSPGEVPQRATAAQLAARKIKTAKPRRAAGAPPVQAQQSANFAPQASGFNTNFGASAPAPSANGATGFAFGGNNNNAFGGGATNSFPPAQPATPSNNFSNSSFPAFGGGATNTGFNFTAGGNNPFAASSAAPATNGTTPAPAFGGSSIFNSQPQNNPFGGLGQNNAAPAPSTGMFGTSNAASSAPMFGTANAAPSPAPNMFGTTSAAPTTNMFGTPTSAPQSNMFSTTSSATATAPTPAFTFGASSTPAQNTTSAPPTTNMFGGFGATTQTASSAQNSIFTGFGARAQSSEPAPAPSAPQSNMFGGAATSAQGASDTTATAPSMFSFGANTQQKDTASTAAPSTSLFGATSSAATAASTPAPASNPFAALAPAPASTSSQPSLFGASTTPAQEKPAASSNLFSGLKRLTESSNSATAETPKANPWASLPKPEEQSKDSNTATPKLNLFSSLKQPTQNSDAGAGTPKINLFGSLNKTAEQNKMPGAGLFASLGNPDSTPIAKPVAGASKSSLFGNLNKDKSAESTEKPTGSSLANKGTLNAFSTPQPAKSTENKNVNDGAFTTQPKPSSGLFAQPTASKETSSSTNLFSKKSTSTTPSSNLFAPQPAASTPAGLNTEPATGSELPKIPKVHVPKEWAVPGATNTKSSNGADEQILSWTTQLAALNVRYRQQLASLPPTGDWSAVSLWHSKITSELKTKIDNAKKARAGAKGITGHETTVSKRKVDQESPDLRETSPTKRARPAAPADSPTPQPSVSYPKLNPPSSSSTNLFATLKQPTASTPTPKPASTNMFASQSAIKSTAGSSSAPGPPAGFTPSFGTVNGTSTTSSGFKPSASSGFQPSSTSASTGGFKPSSAGASTSGFNPSLGGASNGGTSSFASQFAATAKTKEQLTAERKKKEMDEDYDSDDETKEEWSARWDKKEAERVKAEQEKMAAAPMFNMNKTTSSSSLFSGAAKSTTGTSSPGLFTSRGASPALSGTGSVFDAGSAVHTSSSNIFGHLSSAPSSNDQDDSGDDEDAPTKSRNDGSEDAAQTTTPPKRRPGESEESENGEQTTKRPSLLSRITRDNDSDADKENNGAQAGFTNGTTTPAGKPFAKFDFDAAIPKTAPPKSDTFGGDQTFKPGTPIKFGGVPATEKKTTAPPFQFSLGAPSPSEVSSTPAKPPPASLFSSLGSSSLFPPTSSASSVPSSVFSSRAGTPLSEADNSTAEGADDDEEGGKQAQVDFTQLTEDEVNEHDVVFHTDTVVAKYHGKNKDGVNSWMTAGRGPLWILKNKTTGKCIVRVRIPNGSTPVNYQILPTLKSNVVGQTNKQVSASRPAQGGGLQQLIFATRTPEIAQEFSTKYNESLPSN